MQKEPDVSVSGQENTMQPKPYLSFHGVLIFLDLETEMQSVHLHNDFLTHQFLSMGQGGCQQPRLPDRGMPEYVVLPTPAGAGGPEFCLGCLYHPVLHQGPTFQ